MKTIELLDLPSAPISFFTTNQEEGFISAVSKREISPKK
jgi:hypothetical protein